MLYLLNITSSFKLLLMKCTGGYNRKDSLTQRSKYFIFGRSSIVIGRLKSPKTSFNSSTILSCKNIINTLLIYLKEF